MTGLANITGKGSVVVLTKKKVVSNSPRDWQDLRKKDFVHTALANKYAPNYNHVGTAQHAK